MSDIGTEFIQVLWRQPDTMALYGIPYDMRPGQAPRDLLAKNPDGSTNWSLAPPSWVFLGAPGWWGNMSADRQADVQTFLNLVSDCVPQGPGEWARIPKDPP